MKTINRILSESDDRKAKPQNDQISEVQPLKWKKAPKGQEKSQPMNMPMNPDAKKPSELPDGYPVLQKIMAGAFKELQIEEMDAAPRKGAILDSQGREVEVSVSGAEDDVQIDEISYVDSDEEVPESEVEFIMDNYQDALYEKWLDRQIGRADFDPYD